MKIGLSPVEKQALVNELRRLITVKANYKSEKASNQQDLDLSDVKEI
jgi:hypothetical protein